MNLNFYGKWYESNGAGQCRLWHHFSIGLINRSVDKKLFGPWYIYYDGYFNFFNAWPLTFRWHSRGITKLEYIEEHLK